MPSIPQIASALQTVLISAAEQAAQATGCLYRRRRFDGARLVQTLVAAWLAHPDATYETMVGVAADFGISITPQSLCERFTPALAACLAQVLGVAVQQVMAADPATLPLLDRFVAVEIQDSTIITLPDALASEFQGCGGSRGRVAAACKAQFRWELRSGQLDGPILQDGRASDRALSFRVRARAGTLRLRDLGYWHLDDLAQDDRDGRLFLTRLKPGTALFLSDGQRVELAELLASTSADELDLALEIGVQQRLSCRLVARRLAQDVAEQRRRQAERTAKRKGRSLSATTLALCSWDVCVTNVPAERLSAAEAWILLRVRWQIELLFKLWKQHGKLDSSRGTQPYRVLCELYAKLIGLLIQHWILLAGCWQQADRSLVKAARRVRAWAERVFRTLCERERLEQLLGDLLAAVGRAGRQTRRKTTLGTWQLLGGTPASLT